nr:hypothetical protein [Nanoarchaeota archaeon]
MGLINNKRGVVFTVLAIVIAVFFTLIFSARVEKPVDYKITLIETRIGVLNDYMGNFFDYARGMASITGYSALQGVIQDLNDMKAPNDEFETQYVYCIRTGNLTTSKICPGMINKTLIYYLNRIKDIARKELNMNSDYRINNITTNQTLDAFSIEVIVNLSLYINDTFANLSDTRLVTSMVSINGLLDPLYLLNGTYNQTIKKTAIRKPDWLLNSTDLKQLYYNHEYRNYKKGISFINRIKGNFVSNDFGIESFVNHTGPGVSYDDNDTMVDYLFWQKKKFRCDTEIVEIINSLIISEPGFQLDETHRLNFNIKPDDVRYTCPQE